MTANDKKIAAGSLGNLNENLKKLLEVVEYVEENK